MRADRRRFVSMAIGAAASCSLSGLSTPALAKRTGTRAYTGPIFGTQWRLVLGNDKSPDTALKHIEKSLNQIDASISPFRNDSTLSRFNRMNSSHIATVDPALSKLIRTSITVARLTNGAFDPTVGPLVNRFGFGPIKGSANCSYEDVHCTERSLSKSKAGVTLDLCGLGKGYAVDCIAQGLQQNGFHNFLFDIGGEMCGVGHHPSGRPWQVAIEPASNEKTHSGTVKLGNVSIATSGLQHNQFSYRAKPYGHLVDRANDAPAEPRCHSVSVVHTSATLADAWSTALFVAGPERGIALAQQYRLHTFFQSVSGVPEDSTSTGSFFSATGGDK